MFLSKRKRKMSKCEEEELSERTRKRVKPGQETKEKQIRSRQAVYVRKSKRQAIQPTCTSDRMVNMLFVVPPFERIRKDK